MSEWKHPHAVGRIRPGARRYVNKREAWLPLVDLLPQDRNVDVDPFSLTYATGDDTESKEESVVWVAMERGEDD